MEQTPQKSTLKRKTQLLLLTCTYTHTTYKFGTVVLLMNSLSQGSAMLTAHRFCGPALHKNLADCTVLLKNNSDTTKGHASLRTSVLNLSRIAQAAGNDSLQQSAFRSGERYFWHSEIRKVTKSLKPFPQHQTVSYQRAPPSTTYDGKRSPLPFPKPKWIT
eukprot:5451323-Amphidinium_carterae.1